MSQPVDLVAILEDIREFLADPEGAEKARVLVDQALGAQAMKSQVEMLTGQRCPLCARLLP